MSVSGRTAPLNTPIRSIAAGFDGSPDAAGAVRWAFALAAQVGADVAVVHAIGLLEHAVDGGVDSQLEEAVRELVTQSSIDPARVQFCPVDGDPCSALVRAGQPPAGADLLVVGSRGRGAHSGLLGSTSLELAEHSDVPVVIVPSGRLGATALDGYRSVDR